MASIILRSVGAAAGNALLPGVGGAFLGVIGGAVGGVIDGKLGLGTHVTGPRLGDLSVQDSRYGAGIPIIYGRARVAGNVIWSTDLIQAQHNNRIAGSKGGLGGGSTTTTTFTYSVHCAVGICAGPIGGISTIWADSKIIYQDGVWTSGTVDGAVIYTGAPGQAPDAFMQSILGSGNVPAYKNTAYVVFENLQLGNFGNRLPNLTFEVMPTSASTAPSWLGGLDAGISELNTTVTAGNMLPIALDGGGVEVSTVLAGGYVKTGSSCVFEVVEYDVTENTPLEQARIQSASFTVATPHDSSWALAPDNRFIAMYLQNSATVTHNFVIYDTETRQFGAVYSVNLSASSSLIKQIAWIDAQHFVIDDSSGGARGLHVFARAGMGVVDLGFFNVWGAGSATSLQPFYNAQFVPFGGGLMAYACDPSVILHLTLYARPLAWRNNTLTVGAQYTVVSALPLMAGNAPTALFVRTGASEWTLWYGNMLGYQAFSFEPGPSSATITRASQSFTTVFGVGTSNFPVYYGDRLVVVQRSNNDNYYRLSELILNASGFALGLSEAIVVNSLASEIYFNATRIDSARLLLLGSGGPASDIGQLGIIQRSAVGSTLDTILGDILSRAGYASGDFDTSSVTGIGIDGYVLQEPMTARAAIEPLQVFTPFDLVESADTLKTVPRSATIAASIPSGEWRAAPENQDPPPALDTTRAQELDLPLEIDIDYIDAGRNFEVNTQRARRIVTRAQAVQKIALPIVCAADAAKQIAETRLYTMWAERELVRIRISRRWLALDPGDVVDLGTGNLLRVTHVNQVGGLMQVEGFYVTAAALDSAALADTGTTIDRPLLAPFDSSLYLMDLPLLQATDDQPGVYAAATGLPGWMGASLWRAADGVNYSSIASLNAAATAGIAVTALPGAACEYMDRVNTIQVQLIQGTLSSCALTDLYNGANAALLGGEIIQFQTATLTGPGLYVLSNLLRGRRGTEAAAGMHAAGENFVLLAAGTVDFVPALLTDRGAMYEFRALTKGQSLGDAQDTGFTYGLATIRPFSPANIRGTRASGTGSDLTVTWKRRARLNAAWIDYVDVPLDEPVELYDVDVMNGGSAVRVFSSLTAPTVTYTAAQQSADWPGGIPASFTLNVYQISARYGRGSAGAAAV